jgi:hypothetical protein
MVLSLDSRHTRDCCKKQDLACASWDQSAPEAGLDRRPDVDSRREEGRVGDGSGGAPGDGKIEAIGHMAGSSSLKTQVQHGHLQGHLQDSHWGMNGG